ncbi:response regulator, partial [candidate division KSB1 bacterium]|nr:response regulator [candidate division KSB1 bacterium]
MSDTVKSIAFLLASGFTLWIFLGLVPQILLVLRKQREEKEERERQFWRRYQEKTIIKKVLQEEKIREERTLRRRGPAWETPTQDIADIIGERVKLGRPGPPQETPTPPKTIPSIPEKRVEEPAGDQTQQKIPVRRRILVVDDESEMLELMKDMLEMEDFDIRTAANGQEALNVFGQFGPELVVTDIRMVGLDGFDFVAQARRMKPDIMVIYVSAWFTDIEICKK